jgi:hypothetical protein
VKFNFKTGVTVVAVGFLALLALDVFSNAESGGNSGGTFDTLSTDVKIVGGIGAAAASYWLIALFVL